MRRINAFGFLLLIFLFSGFNPGNGCDQKSLSMCCKSMLSPYIYDSAKLTKITYKQEPQTYFVEIPVFDGERYRLVFNTSGLPKKINVSVYNKPFGEKKRELLFTNSNSDSLAFGFNPPKVKNLFIDYIIPSDSSSIEGCMMMMVGYKGKNKN